MFEVKRLHNRLSTSSAIKEPEVIYRKMTLVPFRENFSRPAAEAN